MKIQNVRIKEISNDLLVILFDYCNFQYKISIQIINDKQNKYKIVTAGFMNRPSMNCLKRLIKTKSIFWEP